MMATGKYAMTGYSGQMGKQETTQFTVGGTMELEETVQVDSKNQQKEISGNKIV